MGHPDWQRGLVSVLVSAAAWTHPVSADRRNQRAPPVARARPGERLMRAVGYFDSPLTIAHAGREAERAGWQIVDILSPAFDEQLVVIAGATRSPVAVSGLLGGVLGVFGGIVLTVGTVR